MSARTKLRRWGVVFLLASVSMAPAAEPAQPPPSPAVRDPAQPKVVVTLVSDGETWVSITNVRTPAKMKSVDIALAPGNYEVIGRRKGYRDVQRSLQVRSSATRVVLAIICTESVR